MQRATIPSIALSAPAPPAALVSPSPPLPRSAGTALMLSESLGRSLLTAVVVAQRAREPLVELVAEAR